MTTLLNHKQIQIYNWSEFFTGRHWSKFFQGDQFFCQARAAAPPPLYGYVTALLKNILYVCEHSLQDNKSSLEI